MTKSSSKSNKLGGRPKGIVRSTCVRHGAYASKQRLGDIMNFWRKHKPCNAHRVEEIIHKYLRQLNWDEDHPQYKEIRDLAVLTVSRSDLFLTILEKDFKRDVYDTVTRNFAKQRPADQFRRLEELDDDIQNRIRKLGFIKK